MSGILAIFGRAASSEGAVPPGMLSALRRRGDAAVVWRGPAAVLAATRFGWEEAGGSAGPSLAREDGCVVAADATLYYRAQLVGRLEAAGVRPRGGAPAELILAAYRVWGSGLSAELEGDFAFALYDGTRGRVLIARDPGGKRPLFYARMAGGIVAASTIDAVRAHPRCPGDLNEAAIAATAAGLLSAVGTDTCYRAIEVLGAGSSLEWRSDDRSGTFRTWQPPEPGTGTSSRLTEDEAAEALRGLLIRSTAERLAPAGRTVVWMSGGWDSPAVFAAGRHHLDAEGISNRKLQPVSISYPAGDPGREDELIEEIAGRWDAAVRWIPIDTIPFQNGAEARAGVRGEPFAHLYEEWNRALARGARACEARVALDGNGGDQLFQASDVYLADLLWGGRWLQLRRDWRSRHGHHAGFRPFFKTAIQPVLPPGMLRLAEVLRGGRPLAHYMDRALPPWIDADFARRHGLRDRDSALLPRRTGRRADAEMLWYLTLPFIAHAFAVLAELALEEGVELRSPLYDRRIIEFACGRPTADRVAGRETKRVLRRAMRGLLPDSVLAPRAQRTGTTTAYSIRGMASWFPRAYGPLLEGRLALEELGVIRREPLRAAVERFMRHGEDDHYSGVALCYTLNAELWLQAHTGVDEAGGAQGWEGGRSTPGRSVTVRAMD